MHNIHAIRGMNDILPSHIGLWQKLEDHIRDLFNRYVYQEIRFPLLEKTELFARGIGEATDIIEKEMYTFLDRNQESLSLRPEGTASCVRAAIQHGLLYHQQQKLWYCGPMFRYERPQKGRYRQFHQIGVETFGFSGSAIEAELLLMTAKLWEQLGLSQTIYLQLNSLGTPETRKMYRDDFVLYCKKYFSDLDEDSQRRLETNPLRILDSKNEQTKQILENAPKITDYLDVQTKRHFEHLCQNLDKVGVSYTINPKLVRGLDYYTGTVFEWVTDALGAQGAVCAGGRYDGLVEALGGEKTSAVGFALGVERIIALLEQSEMHSNEKHPSIDAFMIMTHPEAETIGIFLAEKLRKAFPTLRLWLNYAGGSLKSQLKRADKSGARFALILGEDELLKDMVTYKPLRDGNPQISLPFLELLNYLRSTL